MGNEKQTINNSNEVINIYTIAEYTFTQTKAGFAISIHGKTINYVSDSLDSAIMMALAFKYDGKFNLSKQYLELLENE